uniref:Uncharacterized protein n=1 Tax=Cacopsylla melanoneura TaxID=428564 RepID=A0A8D8ZET2_9HEMI
MLHQSYQQKLCYISHTNRNYVTSVIPTEIMLHQSYQQELCYISHTNRNYVTSVIPTEIMLHQSYQQELCYISHTNRNYVTSVIPRAQNKMLSKTYALNQILYHLVIVRDKTQSWYISTVCIT